MQKVEVLRETNDFFTIKQCIAIRDQFDDFQATKYLNILIRKALSPEWFSLFVDDDVNEIIITLRKYHVLAIQSLLNGLVEDQLSPAHRTTIVRMLAECCHMNQLRYCMKHAESNDSVVRTMVSVVDKVYNSGEQIKELPSMLISSEYYRNLTSAVYDLYFDNSLSLKVTSAYVITLTKRGHAEMLSNLLCKQKDCELIEQLLCSLAKDGIVIQKLLSCLVTAEKGDRNEVFVTVLSRLVNSDALVRQLFTSKLFLGGSGFSGFTATTEIQLTALLFITDVLKAASALQNSDQESVLITALINLLRSWKETVFVKQTTEVQQTFVTYAILLLVNEIGKDRITDLLKISAFQGIQARIAVSSLTIQKHASMVAQTIVQMSDPSNTSVLFDHAQNDLAEFNTRILELRNEKTEEPVELQTEQVETKTPSVSENEEDDPDAPLFGNKDQSDSEDSEQSEEEDVDSDSSLEAADLSDDETDLEKVKPPKYLSELHSYLTTNQSDNNFVDILYQGVRSAAGLITQVGTVKNSTELHDRCIALLSALYHIRENYGLDNFDEMLFAAKKALVVNSTEKSVKYLTKLYYSDTVNLSDKLDILRVLSDAALNLSNRHPLSQSKLDQVENESKNEEAISYPERTRRWTKQRKVPEDDAKANLYVPYARLFAYPLLKDPYFKLMNEDSYVLASLIRALGIFVYCCGSALVGQEIGKEVGEFVWASRFRGVVAVAPAKVTEKQPIRLLEHHLDQDTGDNKKSAGDELRAATSVRQNVLTSLLQCYITLETDALMDKFVDVIPDMIQWLISNTEEDPDEECRGIAQSCLGVLKSKLEQNL